MSITIRYELCDVDLRDCPNCVESLLVLSWNPSFIIGVDALAPVSGSASFWFRFLLRQKKKMRTPMMIAAPRPPPIAPPMIAPLLDFESPSFVPT